MFRESMIESKGLRQKWNCYILFLRRATQKLFVTNSAIIWVKTLLCPGFESMSTERASGYELGVREGGMAGADVPSHPKVESGKP